MSLGKGSLLSRVKSLGDFLFEGSISWGIIWENLSAQPSSWHVFSKHGLCHNLYLQSNHFGKFSIPYA
jgi:hypothetical protein